MICTYNGKEYVCKTFSDGRVELRTNKYEDETFKNFKGEYKNINDLYIKYVDISECKNLKYLSIFAVYNDESIEVFRMDSERHQLLVFTGFFKRTRDFTTKEANDIILDKELALEYIGLMRLCK